MVVESREPMNVEDDLQKSRLFELNLVTISGNLTADPVQRETTSGVPVANFAIVWSRRFTDGKGKQKDKQCLIGVVAWRELASFCYTQLRKGSGIIVEGELQSKARHDESGDRYQFVELKARRIQCANTEAEVQMMEL